MLGFPWISPFKSLQLIRNFHTTRPLRYDSRFVEEYFQNPLKIASNSEFAVGHPVYGEMLSDGTYRVDGFFTHGPFGHQLLKFNILPWSKDPRAQNVVPLAKSIIVPGNWVSLAVPNSQTILDSQGIKQLLDSFKE